MPSPNPPGTVGIDQVQYERGLNLRVMPPDIQRSAEYIIHLLNPTRDRRGQVYALEYFSNIVEIEDARDEAWGNKVTIMVDRPARAILTVPLTRDGFVITPNPNSIAENPDTDRFIEIGYFLDSTSLANPY